jgi:DNA (cytosine-5)-methyltransferase 1
MRDGECWELPMSARPTFARGYGLWPTIRSTDGERGGRGDLIQAVRGNPNSYYRLWPTPRASEDNRSPEAYTQMQAKRSRSPEDISSLSVAVKLWPTPVAKDTGRTPDAHMAMRQQMPGGPRYKPTSLAVMVNGIERGMWPTPTVCGNYNRKGASPTSGDGLATSVSQFPTPTKRDHKGGANWSNRQRQGKPRPESDMTLCDVVERTGGSLNPTWVEWLMGWPLGWTDLKPLATARSRNAPPWPSHSWPMTDPS